MRFNESSLHKITVFAKSNKVAEELLGECGLLTCLRELVKGRKETTTTKTNVFGVTADFDKAIEAGRFIAKCIKDFANRPTQ